MPDIKIAKNIKYYKAFVYYDDVYEVTSAPVRISLTKYKNPLKIYTEAFQQKKLKIGEVKIERRKGRKIYRIIILDFDKKDPLARKAIPTSLRKCFKDASEDGIRNIAMPVLGKKHGGLDEESFLGILSRFIGKNKRLTGKFDEIGIIPENKMQEDKLNKLLKEKFY